MKNRRLNVLFIAIIALAAAPQAFQDAYSLVNAAHERAETEFWSVFLSYSTPDADGTEKRAATELLAARSKPEAKEACQLEQMAEQPVEAARSSRSNENSARARGLSGSKPASAKANPGLPETFEVEFENDEAVAGVYKVRTIALPEKELKALKAASLHARDSEKFAGIADRVTVASALQGNQNPQIKMRLMDADKLLRQRTRNNRDRDAFADETSPNTVGSM